MHRFRILVLTSLFWPEGGGAEIATYLIIKEILSKYFDITIVSGTRKPSIDILKYCRYICWEILRSSFKLSEWLKLFSSSSTLRKLVNTADIVYIPSHTLLPLAIIIKKIKPDTKTILHLHNYQPLTYTSVILHSNKPGLKNDLIVERYEHDSIIRAVAVGILESTNIINTVALHYADLIICVSKRQYEILTHNIPNVVSKVVVVYNPLSKKLPLEVKSKEPSIMYLGGSSFIKGFHVVLGCLYKSLREGLNIRFMLAGHYNLSTLRLLNRFARSGNVSILDRIDYNLVLKICSTCWGLLFPSICEEPLPYAVMEAMAVGTIPVASRVGGVPEIVKNSPAEDFLFEPGKITEILDRISKLISLSERDLNELSIKVREHAIKRFSIESTEITLLKSFYKVISHTP